MSDGVMDGSLPASFGVDGTDEAIAAMARSRDDDAQAPTIGGRLMTPSRRAKLDRIARGEQAAPHLIASVRFGRGRVTTCTACAFTCTGRTDGEMASRWTEHVESTRRATRHGEPVYRRNVRDDDAEDDDAA